MRSRTLQHQFDGVGEAPPVRLLGVTPAAAGGGERVLLELPLAELLVELVDAALAEHAENAALHRTLLMRLPRGMRDPEPEGRTEMVAAMLLTKARDARRLDMMVFTARRALLGAIDEAVCTHPEWLRDPDFRDELVWLLSRYLEPGPQGRDRHATVGRRRSKDASPRKSVRG